MVLVSFANVHLPSCLLSVLVCDKIYASGRAHQLDVYRIRLIFRRHLRRRGGLMVSALVPGSSGWGHCVVFLGKTLHSYSAYLHPSVQIGTNIPSRAGVEIFSQAPA